MDVFDILKMKRDCIADDPPPCSAVCPLGIDIRDFIKKIRVGLYSAAYKTFSRFAIMPGVVCHICGEPCKDACVLKDLGGSISLRELEHFCWQQSHDKPVSTYFIPPKDKSILILGGGISAISCAVKLANRGYQVEIREKSDRLGGRLWDIDDGVLPKTVLQNEIDKVLQMKFLKVKLNTHVKELDIGGYDAVLVATGDGNESFGAKKTKLGMDHKDGVFYAGTLLCPKQAPLDSIYQGATISYMIEDYLKVGKVVTEVAKKEQSRYKPDLKKIAPLKAAGGQTPGGWTPNAAKLEAERCLLCSCENCYNACMMMQHYNKKVKPLMSDIFNTINLERIGDGAKPALYPVMSCFQCGSCKASCPVEIDVKRLCLETRRIMHKQGELPDAYYDYWINDMLHANSEEAELFIEADGNSAPRYVYFPSCQMGASNPDYVIESYNWLLKAFPNEVSLMLCCCGAPAYWAGNEELHSQAVDMIKEKLYKMGEAEVILSCTTCAQMFKEHLPEVRTVSLWELMAGRFEQSGELRETVSVFDPCSSWEYPKAQQSIRALVKKAGYTVDELETSGDTAPCCGYGGLIYTVNAELVSKINQRNKEMSDLEFITYCTNCKDIFVLNDKPSRHILDLLFLKGDGGGTVPALSERRDNRRALKKQLTKQILGIEYKEADKSYRKIKLFLSDEIRAKMDLQLIIEDNVKRVIEHAEISGQRICYEGSDLFTAYLRQGNLTFWVQYRPLEDGYAVENVYFHRLRIKEA